MLAVLAGKLTARRKGCAPVAGKSTLNRLELSRPEPSRYHKISHDPAAIEGLLVDLFLEAHARAPKQIILDLDATDDPLHGRQSLPPRKCLVPGDWRVPRAGRDSRGI
ncbi:transposase [Inquilinus sp. CA228]|uniref:transposase n=1 Tax=Inquilinus sp. CA228 TaxID=3455609 RepID=UPI003F8D3B48